MLLLQKLENIGVKERGQLKVYRGMPHNKAIWILDFFAQEKNLTAQQMILSGDKDHAHSIPLLPIDGHAGDFEQAKQYASSKDEVVVEFTLKPGAHKLLFSPEYMGVAPTGSKTTALFTNQGTYPIAENSQGQLPGYIGMNSEAKGDFSLALESSLDKAQPKGGTQATRLIFQMFVESTRIVDKTLDHMPYKNSGST